MVRGPVTKYELRFLREYVQNNASLDIILHVMGRQASTVLRLIERDAAKHPGLCAPEQLELYRQQAAEWKKRSGTRGAASEAAERESAIDDLVLAMHGVQETGYDIGSLELDGDRLTIYLSEEVDMSIAAWDIGTAVNDAIACLMEHPAYAMEPISVAITHSVNAVILTPAGKYGDSFLLTARFLEAYRRVLAAQQHASQTRAAAEGMSQPAHAPRTLAGRAGQRALPPPYLRAVK